MITIKEINNVSFKNKTDALHELIRQRDFIIHAKKSVIKETDSLFYIPDVELKQTVTKGINIDNDFNDIRVKSVINTINYYDSHGDVSIKGSWNRTVKNSKNIYLLQEHQMKFDKIISDEVKSSVQKVAWKELGYDYEGTTECLMFDALIKQERNPFMYNQYSKGYVKEHSAGLRYVQLLLAVNSDEKWAREEKEVWDNYYENIVNKEDVNDYFWAVVEQKLIEGSAVVKGSNPATPTISVELAKCTSTQNEDSQESTPQKRIINLNFY